MASSTTCLVSPLDAARVPSVTQDDFTLDEALSGLRSSAGFFTSLRANLRLADSPPSPALTATPNREYKLYLTAPRFKSPTLNSLIPSTIANNLVQTEPSPTSQHKSTSGHGHSRSRTSSISLLPNSLRPASGTACRTSSIDSDTSSNADTADMVVRPANTLDERNQALLLVQDSVLLQSSPAIRNLLLHPLILLPLLVAVVTVHHLILRPQAASLRTNLLAWTLLATTLALLATHYVVLPYHRLSKAITPDWLANDEVIIATRALSEDPDQPSPHSYLAATRRLLWTTLFFPSRLAEHASPPPDGAAIVGVLVLHAPSKRTNRQKPHTSTFNRSAVRAWAVAPAQRRQGVGRALLREAVRLSGRRGADGVGFSGEHAHAHTVLPALFAARAVCRRDRMAQGALTRVVEDVGGAGGGGGGGRRVHRYS